MMPFVEAKERWKMPSPAPDAWCNASDGPLPSREKFPTLSVSLTYGNSMTVIYRISYVAVALIVLGMILVGFDMPDGNFVAGAGCLLFAGAGIWLRLKDRRQSRLKS